MPRRSRLRPESRDDSRSPGGLGSERRGEQLHGHDGAARADLRSAQVQPRERGGRCLALRGVLRDRRCRDQSDQPGGTDAVLAPGASPRKDYQRVSGKLADYEDNKGEPFSCRLAADTAHAITSLYGYKTSQQYLGEMFSTERTHSTTKIR